MVSVTNTAQLSMFSTIKTILLANATLSPKFKNEDFYEFEPDIKSINFKGFPYFVINVPSTKSEHMVFSHATTMKNFTSIITMVMEYEARDNFTPYCNAVLAAIEAAESTFQDLGYFNLLIDFESSDKDELHQKRVCTGIFTVSNDGLVAR